jgi:hypothetical protein
VGTLPLLSGPPALPSADTVPTAPAPASPSPTVPRPAGGPTVRVAAGLAPAGAAGARGPGPLALAGVVLAGGFIGATTVVDRRREALARSRSAAGEAQAGG